MRMIKLAGLVLTAACLASSPVLARPNALDAYVAKPDPSFAWKVVGPLAGPGYHGAVIELTSQTWTAPKDVDRTVWKHWMTVIVPDKVSHSQAFLYITGGDHGDPAPSAATERFAKLATDTSSVVVELDDVPNQPLTFADDPLKKARVERSEDVV